VTEPRLVVGVALYGGGEHVEEALESILGQTYRDIAVVLTDDLPSSEVAAIVGRLHDPRVTYVANHKRLGLVANWKRAFEVARRRYPQAPYFAWASDHDAWHPHWAERLVAALDDQPATVVAYPKTYRMARSGSTMSTKDWWFDTRGQADAARRLRSAVKGMSAGNMVYGVYRVSALERAGVMRSVLLPDRLLLTELAIAGDLQQVPERLFYRRTTEAPTIERQRAAFWPEGLPWYARLPWTWQHVGVIWGLVLLGRVGEPGMRIGERIRIGAAHSAATGTYAVRRLVGRAYVRMVGGRSMKLEAAKLLVRTVRKLQAHWWGQPVLALGRRGRDRLSR
jgi:glycosyltransferase involved in cell wall biosynthesis